MTAICAWLAAHGTSCLEVVAVFFGIVSVWLSVLENIWSWPTALVNVALYTVLFYETGLYSDMGLQVVYFALSLYGWYEWLYGGKGHTALAVSRTPRKVWTILLVVGAAFWAVDGYATSHLPHVALPYVDAGTTTVSLIAQYMMTRKYLENWALWIGVDIVYVGMLVFKGLNLTAFNYAVYLVLAVMGLVAWRKSLRESEAATRVAEVTA